MLNVSGQTLMVIFKGSKWTEYNEQNIKVSDWGGPYSLYIYHDSPNNEQSKIINIKAEAKDNEGKIIKSYSSFKLQAYPGIDSMQYTYFDEAPIELEYSDIKLELSIAYQENGKPQTLNKTLVIKTVLTEQPYNSLWAAFKSV